MQVIHSLQVGGSERLACQLARRLDPAIVRTSICAVDCGGPLADELTKAAVPFHILGRGPRFEWRLIPRFHRFFRHTRPQVVHTHHLTQLIYAGLSARLAGARLIHAEHDYLSLEPPRRRRLLRVLGALCDHVVAVGDQIGTFLTDRVGLPASRVVVIRNGVDLDRYTPDRRISRATLGLPLSGRLIGTVARLDPLKDPGSLLRAFRILLPAHPDLSLVLVGDGALRPELEALAGTLGIRDRVTFLGSRHDVADLLPHLDVFALTSISEGLPFSILEAMACACPIVATTVGDIPRLMGDGVAGITVPPAQPDLLATGVATLLGSPDRAAALGRAARTLIQKHYDFKDTIGRYEAMYGGFSADPRYRHRKAAVSGSR
jgi:glycosyltransferase involved in cell wall biosynthesis